MRGTTSWTKGQDSKRELQKIINRSSRTYTLIKSYLLALSQAAEKGG